MARETRHLHRLLTLLNPLLRHTPFVVETHYRSARCLQVGHDEPHSREQLYGMELYLCHDSSCGLPTGDLIEKALVPQDGLVAGPPRRARQQFLDVPQQVVVRGRPNRIFHPALLQRFVDLWFGKCGIGPKHSFLTHTLLTLDLGKKYFLLVLGAMHVPRSQLAR